MNDDRKTKSIVIDWLFRGRPSVPTIGADRVKEHSDENWIWACSAVSVDEPSNVAGIGSWALAKRKNQRRSPRKEPLPGTGKMGPWLPLLPWFRCWVWHVTIRVYLTTKRRFRISPLEFRHWCRNCQRERRLRLVGDGWFLLFRFSTRISSSLNRSWRISRLHSRVTESQIPSGDILRLPIILVYSLIHYILLPSLSSNLYFVDYWYGLTFRNLMAYSSPVLLKVLDAVAHPHFLQRRPLVDGWTVSKLIQKLAKQLRPTG